MLRIVTALRKNKEGATAIEFAMVAPVLFLLIFGILEFGLVLATQSTLEGATTAAARSYKAAARDNNPGADADAVHSLIARYSGRLVQPGNLRVTAVKLVGWGDAAMPDDVDENEGPSGTVSEVIQYRVYYDYRIYTPFLASLLAGDRGVLLIRTSTVVQNEPSING